MTKEMLFLELAQPDENGISRWVKMEKPKTQQPNIYIG